MSSPAQKLPTIRGTQIGLRNPALVDQIKADMRNGRFTYEEPRAWISGVRDSRGVYHGLAAALEIYRETGNMTPVRELLRCGRWSEWDQAPIDSRPLPSRQWWGRFRNWIGA